MTLLVASVLADGLSELIGRAEAAWSRGADAVELRIDTLDAEPEKLAAYLRTHADRTWIVTCRRAEEGGYFRGDTRARVALLIAVARGSGAYVDFELADWNASSNIRQKVRLAAAQKGSPGVRLILSRHDFGDAHGGSIAAPAPLEDAGDGVVVKGAYQAADAYDSFAALDAMHRHGDAVSAICMGEAGLWTRVLAKKFNAFASYAALTAEEATAPAQLTLDEMIGRYRWRDIDPSTSVYGVLGDPVAHSMSPFLFNRWFTELGMNAVYVPLLVRRGGGGVSRFLDGCMARSWLDLRGLSVTIPHKTAALEWVGQGADSLARWIGAANTLSFIDDTPAAYNTDCYAALSAIAGALGCRRTELVGRSVDVLGAGGSARALVEGLYELGCNVTIYGRSADKARRFAEEFSCAARSWEERADRHGDILINCTPIGMWPATEESPVPPEAPPGCDLVFDLIYRPLETTLLRAAAAAGCKTLNGVDMFVRQAAMQLELWTSQSPDVASARDALTQDLRRADPAINGTGEHDE